MIPRLYFAGTPVPGGTVVLSGTASHHLAHVLRLGPGADCILFTGDGGEWRATVQQIERGGVTVRVEGYTEFSRESPLAVTLVQALCLGDKMDLIVRKAVELGVQRIVPVESAGSVVRLKGDRAEARVAHWRAIVIAACEQCGRNTLPEVTPICRLTDWLARAEPAQYRWLLSPRGDVEPLRTRPVPAGPVSLLVGPESGFTPAEEDAGRRAGFEPVRLGPRILRTESAALAMLAAMQALWGDF